MTDPTRPESPPDAPGVGNSEDPAPARWNGTTLFAFRFFLAYYLLVWLPEALSLVPGVGLWQRMTASLGRWPITHVLNLPGQHSPAHFPADALPPVIATVVLAAACLLVASVWSLVDRRRRSHPRAYAWLRAAVRFTLAAVMLDYGLDKILPGQFGPGVNLLYLTRPVGDLGPFGLLWAFMGASRPYAIFAGTVETAGGLLLFPRRTATLGGLVSAGAMANVVMLNFAYDVPVKLFATQILLMALFVTAPDARRLVSMLVMNRPTRRRRLARLFDRQSLDRTARAIGVVLAVGIGVWDFHSSAQIADGYVENAKAPFHGIWEVQEIDRNGTVVAPLATDTTTWRRVVFPWADRGVLVVSVAGSSARYTSSVDTVASTLELSRPTRDSGRGASSILDFAYTRPDPAHLELRRLAPNGDSITLRLRRIDPSVYPLLRHRHAWWW